MRTSLDAKPEPASTQVVSVAFDGDGNLGWPGSRLYFRPSWLVVEDLLIVTPAPSAATWRAKLATLQSRVRPHSVLIADGD